MTTPTGKPISTRATTGQPSFASGREADEKRPRRDFPGVRAPADETFADAAAARPRTRPQARVPGLPAPGPHTPLNTMDTMDTRDTRPLVVSRARRPPAEARWPAPAAPSPGAAEAIDRWMNPEAKRLSAQGVCGGQAGQFAAAAPRPADSIGSFGRIGRAVSDCASGVASRLSSSREPVPISDDDAASGSDGDQPGPAAHRLLYPDGSPGGQPQGRTASFGVSAVVVRERLMYEVDRQMVPGGLAELQFSAGSMLLVFSPAAGPSVTVPIDMTALRAVHFGRLGQAGPLSYLDIYHNGISQASPFAALALVNVDVSAIALTTNVRLLLPCSPAEHADFVLCCNRLHGRRYEVDDQAFAELRPHNDPEQKSRTALPYSTGGWLSSGGPTRMSGRARTGVTRKRLSSAANDADDDDDLPILQPPVPTRGELLFVYPENSPDAIHMTTIERARLQPGVYLNDNLIDWDVRRMLAELGAPDRARVYAYNCFFWKKLAAPRERGGPSPHTRVASWTSSVNVFGKEFLVIPINEHQHWFLAVVVNPGALLERARAGGPAPEAAQPEGAPAAGTDVFELLLDAPPADPGSGSGPDDGASGPSGSQHTPIDVDGPQAEPGTYIAVLDSLCAPRTAAIERIKAYLVEEARDKLGLAVHKAWMRGLHIKGARQDNLTDCGCYLLQHLEEVLCSLETMRLELLLNTRAWFAPQVARERRQLMRERMDALSAEYRLRHPDMHQVVDLGHSSDVEHVDQDYQAIDVTGD